LATLVDLPPGVKTAIEFNTYQVPAELGIEMPAQAAACVLDITAAQFAAYLEHLKAEASEDASRLLTDPDLAMAVDRLAVPAEGTILAIGDSLTTYRRSYAELLRHLLALRRPADGIRFQNRAQSGYTSTHARRSTYSQYVKLEPDLVFILLGGNDCQRFGAPALRTLVSIGEYRENIEAIVKAFREHTSAHLVLLTPIPVVPEMLRRVPDFSRSRLTWDNTDLQACGDALRSLALQHDLPIVDLMETLSPDPDLYFGDGVHLGPKGHEVILRLLLEVMG
jgi:acyl-CoA thioesterase I